ncbi:hypothetical protein ALC53_12987 [Atta colombica]|uniref:Uncharacterized protein n=1 Tax=Atta colombica TaxID=520822 RepID=A0A195AX58_9HYME|nr:hypothetical protein ALC53_12987 [Atta colombica]
MTLSDTLYVTRLCPEGTRVVITLAAIGQLRPRKKIVPGLPQISTISKNSAVETIGSGNCSVKHLDAGLLVPAVERRHPILLPDTPYANLRKFVASWNYGHKVVRLCESTRNRESTALWRTMKSESPETERAAGPRKCCAGQNAERSGC